MKTVLRLNKSTNMWEEVLFETIKAFDTFKFIGCDCSEYVAKSDAHQRDSNWTETKTEWAVDVDVN